MFSALIPIYNHEKFLRQAINSCLAAPDVTEIVLVDDGSKDNSKEIARSFCCHKHVRLLEDGGQNAGAHARINQLCEAASNEWLAVLNSDDCFVPHRFSHAKIQIREKAPDILAGSISICNQDGAFLGLKRGPFDPEYPFPQDLSHFSLDPRTLLLQLINQNFISTTSNMIFRKSLFKKLHGFRDYRYAHDWDFALRGCLEGRFVFTPAFMTQYRLHSSNTIKEDPRFVDGEVTKLFSRINAEYPELFSDREALAALTGNRHVDPGAIKFFDHRVRNLVDGSMRDSFLLEGSMRDSFELRSDLAKEIRKCFGASNEARVVRGCIPQERIGCGPESADIYVPGSDAGRASEQGCEKRELTSTERLRFFLRPGNDVRKRVIVLSGFFAVGGVERNTIEIMRHLKDSFSFLVVTFEPHTEHVGSLHHQLDEIGVPCIDLAHLMDRATFFEALAEITNQFRPKIVWIINGSTWLAENAGTLRFLFSGIPIFDQQVYDNEVGWIAEFTRPGILASDFFIAVNRKIAERFALSFKIPQNLIFQIYPALAAEKISQIEGKRIRRNFLEKHYGLDVGKTNIGFIGRLVEQKRPDRFVEIAHLMEDRKDIQFILIGKGEQKKDVIRRVQEYMLENFRIIDFYEDVSDIGAILDGLVVCSEYEGLPIAVLECMAMKVPVLATDVGDIDYVFKMYGGGRIIEHWGAAAVNELLRRWLEERNILRAQLEVNAPKLIKDFSANEIAGTYRYIFSRGVD